MSIHQLPLCLLLTPTLLAGCGGTEPGLSTENPAPIAASAPPGTNGPSNTPVANTATGGGPTSPDAPAKTTKAVIVTSLGTIELELDAAKAPVTVKNFVDYVKKGFYSGTIFHRVKPGFMIQGGGMTPDMKEKPTGSGIQNEATNGLKNERGSIAMARTSDPNSATSQFFINVVANKRLDPSPDGFGYAVFGKVTKGLDVVDKIVKVPTDPNGTKEQDGTPTQPVTPVIIKSVTVTE